MAGAGIKLKLGLKAGVLTVRALIRHPMEVGRRHPAGGERIPAHFITRVICTLDDEVVLDADWGGGIAKDPYLSFEIAGVAPGARFALRWVDNRREQDEITALVPAA